MNTLKFVFSLPNSIISELEEIVGFRKERFRAKMKKPCKRSVKLSKKQMGVTFCRVRGS